MTLSEAVDFIESYAFESWTWQKEHIDEFREAIKVLRKVEECLDEIYEVVETKRQF